LKFRGWRRTSLRKAGLGKKKPETDRQLNGKEKERAEESGKVLHRNGEERGEQKT